MAKKMCISTFLRMSHLFRFLLPRLFFLHSNGVGGALDPRRPDKGSSWETSWNTKNVNQIGPKNTYVVHSNSDI